MCKTRNAGIPQSFAKTLARYIVSEVGGNLHRWKYLPWESGVVAAPYILNRPPVWFHEVLRPDGTLYREAEVNLIWQLTGKQ